MPLVAKNPAGGYYYLNSCALWLVTTLYFHPNKSSSIARKLFSNRIQLYSIYIYVTGCIGEWRVLCNIGFRLHPLERQGQETQRGKEKSM